MWSRRGLSNVVTALLLFAGPRAALPVCCLGCALLSPALLIPGAGPGGLQLLSGRAGARWQHCSTDAPLRPAALLRRGRQSASNSALRLQVAAWRGDGLSGGAQQQLGLEL